MDFEWDESKRRINIEKHHIDFVDAVLIFDGPFINGPAKTVGDEKRWLAVGMIDDVYVTVIYTLRADVTRIISMRRARHGEKRKHQEVFGSRAS